MRMDGEWIELDSPSASADGELWSRHREARGVSPADGIAAMASSFAAQFKASLAASENTWARDLNVIFVFFRSLSASWSGQLSVYPACAYLYVFESLPFLGT